MIFLTVGTQFGFDRLVRAVDDCLEARVIDDEIVAQIGPGRYQPRHMKTFVSLDRDAFETTFRSADGIISHAGMGSITLALQFGKPLLVMPRLKRYREVVNDHQVDTARRFESLGHVLVAYEHEELSERIRQLTAFGPIPRSPDRDGVVDRILDFVSQKSSASSAR